MRRIAFSMVALCAIATWLGCGASDPAPEVSQADPVAAPTDMSSPGDSTETAMVVTLDVPAMT